MIELLKIYLIFCKTGLFTIGGGLAAMPLLQEEAYRHNWLTETEFANMIAISQSTPGPIGINMSTYIGFSQLGFWGSVAATFGMVTPSIIIICLIAKFLMHFAESKIVRSIFMGLRPAVTGIVMAACYSVAVLSIFDRQGFIETGNFLKFFRMPEMIIFAVFLFATNKWKLHTIYYILMAGVIGIIFL